MSSRIMYIELKSGFTDDGPAWIGEVDFSKSGRTAYFNNKAFKHAGKGYYGDIETGESYWISGIKKNGEDRHVFGKGKIQIDKNIVAEYLKLIDFDVLAPNKYEFVDIQVTDKSRFNEILNAKFDSEFDFYTLKGKEIHKLLDEELNYLIEYCIEREKNATYNKGRRAIKKYRIELEDEYEHRIN